MSSVRMCDKCGSIFSELEDGWQAFTATTMKRDEQGISRPFNASMDACAACALKPGTTHAELEDVKTPQARRIARLEKELNIT